MGLFENILSDKESLFAEPIALDFDYQPKLVLHREAQQRQIAECIKPLFQKRNGKNIIITGEPGLGKTVCIKHVLEEIKQETDDISCIYINCWKKDTAFKAILQICEDINFSWVHNKTYEELIEKVIEIINKKSAVIVFDEIDRLTDFKIVYTLLDELFRKSLVLITNNREFVANIDSRIKSRLAAEYLEFLPYTNNQIRDILQERVKYAFVKDVVSEEAFDLIIDMTCKLHDIRHGLGLLKSAGEEAENSSSRNIGIKHVEKAIEKLEGIRSKKISDESEIILKIIKENPKMSIGGLYDQYQKTGGDKSYRTFHRRLKELEAAKLIKINEINKGFEDGRTNEVEAITKLSEF